MSDQTSDAPSSGPRLLSGLLGIPAANRERLSHLIIRGGTPVSVQCHFHQDVVAPFAEPIAAEPGISEQIAELRASGLLGTGVDVTRRDGVFHVKLWNGAHERAAWERRMAAIDAHPEALQVLAAAGDVKAHSVWAKWADSALVRAARSAERNLPTQTVHELAQTQAPTNTPVPTAGLSASQLVRMPTGHSRECEVCGKPAWHTLGDVALHQATCFQLFLERAGTAEVNVAVPTSDVAVPQPAAAEPDALEPRPLAPETSEERPAVSQPASEPAALQVPQAPAAVVLDVDVIGLPDGREMPHPFVIDSLTKVFEVAAHYELGVKVTKVHTEAGQVWITEAMLATLGIAVPPAGRKMLTQFTESTARHPALVEAVQAGWNVGKDSEDGPALTRWTYGHKGAQHVLLAAIPLMTDHSAQPLLKDDPSPGVLARRLALFAGAYRHPYKRSPQSTAFDYVRTLRWSDRTVITEPQRELIHEEAELDGNWTRVPTEHELDLRYLHAYDRSGSYAAGLSSKGHFGVGQPQHIEGPITLDRTTYGLVRVAGMPEVGDWRAPHPLHADVAAVPQDEFWRHTTTVRWAQELGYDPQIVEAWIWPRTMPIFSTWYERVRDAREQFVQMDANGHPDGSLLKEQLKAVYTRMVGQMAANDGMGKPWFAPDRRWGVVAQSRVNLERLIHKIGTATADQRSGLGVWPLAWDNDTIVYASNEPDPHKAWPGEEKNYGQKIGQVHWEGSTMLQDHTQFLTGGPWKGKDQLTKDGWGHGGEQA